MDGSCGDQFTILNESKFGGATADVHVQNAVFLIIGSLGRTRAINGQHGLHVVSSCSTNKFSPLLGQDLCDRFTVLTPESFAGQNHGPRIHIIGVQASGLIGSVNDGAKGFGVHGGIVQIGCQRNGRLIKRLTVHHGIARREVFSDASQVNF